MKKIVSLVLALVMCLSLCGCGKSKEVKDAEEKIAALSANSTYAEIHDAFMTYYFLDSELKEQVENAGILNDYCDSLGHFVLTDAMLEEIEEAFAPRGVVGIRDAEIFAAVMCQYCAEPWGYKDASHAIITRYGQLDAYTFVGYGTADFESSSGVVSKLKIQVLYYAEYDEEDSRGYSIGRNLLRDYN